jgi:hypothetical protein
MGGAVSITAPKLDGKTLYMQDLVNDAEAIKVLFKDMTVYGKSRGMMNANSDLVSLAEILLYIEKDVNPNLSQYYKGMVEMIKESFYYIVGYKKKVRLEISSKRFHKFMYAMFMFSHLWKIFAAADDHIDDDSIFVGEFVRAKDKIRHIDGVRFTKEITDEEWKEEFYKIDSGGRNDGGNGWISFREFANYCCKAVATPEVYSKAGGVRKQADEKYVGPAKPELKQIDFGGAIHHAITATVPSATVRKSSAVCSKVSPVKSTRGNKKKTSTSKSGNNPKSKHKKREVHAQNNLQEPKIVKKKIVNRKKGGKKLLNRHSESSPALSNEPLENAGITVICESENVDITDDLDDGNQDQVDLDRDIMDDAMDEYSSPIAIKGIVDVVACERKEEEDRETALEEYVRPLYRPRSAAELQQDVSEHRAWVDNTALTKSTPKSWISTDADADAFALDREPIPGFGIPGVDMVTFAYDMNQVHADATVHKKYLFRRRVKGKKLWQPKHITRRFQRDVAVTDLKCF